MKKFIFLASIGALGMIGSAKAETIRVDDSDAPTVVYGSAATPDGGQREFRIVQPKNAPNPLGNPIVGPERSIRVFGPVSGVLQPLKSTHQYIYEEPQNSDDRQENYSQSDSRDLGREFQNTLMEANGRVYDIQSYPEQDLNVIGNNSNPRTIYSPNVNN